MDLTSMPMIRSVTHSVRRYTKFLVIGASNAVVDVVVLDGLLWLAPTRTEGILTFYNTIAVLAAICNSYIWNRRWTFRDVATGSYRERIMYVVQAVLNVVLNDVIVVLLSSYLVFSKSVPFFISSNTAKVVAMMSSSTISYGFMSYFVFRVRRKRRWTEDS